jgi:prepilin-type processing-associated H-X9-DG protein
MLFKDDHRQRLQPVSDTQYFQYIDPQQTIFAYRDVKDSSGVRWAGLDAFSALIPYLGGKGNPGLGSATPTFMSVPDQQSKVFRCPSDTWQNDPTPGYRIYNNVINNPNGSPYYPISYGVNADICVVTDQQGIGRFSSNYSDAVNVTGGPIDSIGNTHRPLNCQVNRVKRSAEVMLYADCGVRPYTPTGAALDYGDCLYYTTNYCGGYTLADIANASWLGDRIPAVLVGKTYGAKLDRHKGGKINVCFCDGHVDPVAVGDFDKVRVSPY